MGMITDAPRKTLDKWGQDNSTLFVGPGCKYTTLAAAVAAASAGDSLRIAPATYTEDVTLTAVLNLEALGAVTITGDVVLPAGFTERNVTGSFLVSATKTITVDATTITAPTGGVDLRRAVAGILSKASPDEILKPRIGPEQTQQFAGFEGAEQRYIFYLGAGNEGVVTEAWAVLDVSEWSAIKSKNYELRVYSDCGDVADLTDPDESKLTARFPLRFWVGGTYDPDEPAGDRIHAVDGLECGYLDPAVSKQVYIRLKLPVPFSDGCLIQLWTASGLDTTVIPNQAELASPHCLYCWARYQLGSLSGLTNPQWRLRAGIPGTTRVDTGWAQAASASWVSLTGDAVVAQDAAVYHEGAEATAITVDGSFIDPLWAYTALPHPVSIRDYDQIKLWLRANTAIPAADAVALLASEMADASGSPTALVEGIELVADTWTEFTVDLSTYIGVELIRSLVVGGSALTNGTVTFYVDDIRFIKTGTRKSYLCDQLYKDGTTPGTWLNEASGTGMLVGVACAVKDPQAVPSLSALEENWSLKLDGSETYNWATSGFEDMFGAMAFYFDAGRQIARDWGCLYKAADALEAYRWMVDNPLTWLAGAVGEIPVPTYAGSRVNLEIVAVYYA